MRTIRSALVVTALLLAPASMAAQAEPLTTDLLDRWVTAHDREKEALTAAEPRIREVDEKIRKFRECKTAFEAAGSVSGSRLGGLAARAGIRARCGANSEADIEKEKKAITDRATADAVAAGSLTVPQYTRLRTRLERIYAYGDRAGLTAPENEAVDARRERFASIFGGAGVTSADARAVAGAIESLGNAMGRAGMGSRMMPGQWTADASWLYIHGLFGMMYSSGASAFDGPYQPGQWTRWEMRGDGSDEKQIIERAFLATTEDGGEWWRIKTINTYRDGNRAMADTVILEGLFKKIGDGVQQIVRMRGKMPGDREPNEMMVPENMTTVSTLGTFGTRPTRESVAGATVGTESVRTPAGTFSARLVRFGGAGGRQEWWLTDQVPGGWVKYRASGGDGTEGGVMELIAHGTGAKSELGVR